MEVFAKIEEHVDERRPHLTRGPQVKGVVAVAPYPAFPVARAVEGARATNGQPLGAPGQGEGPVRLDDEVDVVGLHREVEHAKKVLAGLRQSAPNLSKYLRRAKRGKPIASPEGEEHGVAGVVERSGGVGRPRVG
jgi:hypothetical protein